MSEARTMKETLGDGCLRAMLETMLLIRAYEEKAVAMQAAGQAAVPRPQTLRR